MKSNFFIFIVFLFIIGCQNSEKKYANCSSNDAQELVRKIISEQTDKKISNVRYESGEFVFDKANIRASLEQIQFFLESIRTTKEDPNSTKKFCNANLKVTVPANLLSDADTARDTERKIKISQYARELEIENNINVFIKKNIEYSVQPTDDGKEIYVEIESVTWVNLLNEIVSSGLWKPILDVQKANELQENESAKEKQKQEVEKLKQEAEKAKIDYEKLQLLQEKQTAERIKEKIIENNTVSSPLKKSNPSFNCKKATKPTEITICANSYLSDLDVENTRVYKIARNIDEYTTQEIFKHSLKEKYACGTNSNCIANRYHQSTNKFNCIINDEIGCEIDEEFNF